MDLKKFFKNNKNGAIMAGIAIILVIIIVIFILAMLPDGSKSTWGNRLDGIENHQVSETDISKIETDITGSGKASKVSYDLKGRTMNFIVYVNNGVEVKDAKDLTKYILEVLSTDIEEYYDIQVFIVSDGDSNYPLNGYKHKTSSEFSFTYTGE